MKHDPSHQDSPAPATGGGAAVRTRLIPALNPCWRLWLREEGPLELVCLAQVGLELWSVQTDGLGHYFCHNRMIRRVSQECEVALKRDIHAVRGGFVREARLHLEAQVSSNALFQREQAPKLAEITAGATAGSGAGAHETGSVNPDSAPAASAAARAAAVQVSYRRRRHLSSPLRPAAA